MIVAMGNYFQFRALIPVPIVAFPTRQALPSPEGLMPGRRIPPIACPAPRSRGNATDGVYRTPGGSS